MTECVSGEPYSEMEHPCFSKDPFAYIIVYVRIDQNQSVDRRVDFHRSLGGQARVICSCNHYPLIATGRRREVRRVCMTDGCTKKESHVCSNPNCSSRLCQKCLLSYPEDGMLAIDPPQEDIENNHDTEERPKRRVRSKPKDPHPRIIHKDGLLRDAEGHVLMHINGYPMPDGFMSDEQNNVIRDLGSGMPLQKTVTIRLDGSIVDDGQYSESQDSGAEHKPPQGRACDLDEDDCKFKSDFRKKTRAEDYHDEFFLGNYLTKTNQAIEENVAQENINDPDVDSPQAPIPTTDAGGFAYEVKHKNDTELFQVPCHVLLNQAGVLCSRYNQRIVGTSAQQNFIQQIAAKITGMSYPLIYLIGMLFPRHFYAQSKNHPSTIFGVPPLCCYTNRQNSFGFASNLDQSRVYLTNSGSSTSTDVHLTYFNYDVQCNAAMSNIDSRLVSRHGFVVDEMSPTGISLRDKTQTDLDEGVDSHQAALNLAATNHIWHLIYF